jgi:AcrR family transcriptional regulator
MNAMHELTPTTPRSRRRAANLERIVEQATAMILEDGFDGLSLHRLAEALDYTPGALYRYFSGKDALVAEVIARILADIGAMLAATAAEHATASPVARARALAWRWERLANDDPHRFGLILSLLATPRLVLADPALAQPAIAAMLGAMQPLRAALDDAARLGELAPGDAVERAILLFCAAEGVLLLRKQAHHAPHLIDTRRLFGAMLDTLFAGWTPAPPAVSRSTR